MPNRMQVKLYEEEDGGTGCQIHLELALISDFKQDQYRKLGRRKLVRKYVDAACRMLVKNIRPQIEEALKNEQRFFDLSPTEKEKVVAAAFAKQEAEKGDGPGLHPALFTSAQVTGGATKEPGGVPTVPGSGDEGVPAPGRSDNQEVPGTDQKPNNGD